MVIMPTPDCTAEGLTDILREAGVGELKTSQSITGAPLELYAAAVYWKVRSACVLEEIETAGGVTW
jgi:hypothetical protein